MWTPAYQRSDLTSVGFNSGKMVGEFFFSTQSVGSGNSAVSVLDVRKGRTSMIQMPETTGSIDSIESDGHSVMVLNGIDESWLSDPLKSGPTEAFEDLD